LQLRARRTRSGRQTTYTYAANGIDLLEIRQTTGGMNDLLGTYANCVVHRPQVWTDASGQTTTHAYNGAGQLLSVTNPRQETTTYSYNAAGYLVGVTGAIAGATATLTIRRIWAAANGYRFGWLARDLSQEKRLEVDIGSGLDPTESGAAGIGKERHGKERGPHWHDWRRPNEHICPNR
jgi:YD repeat-containing protein